VAAPRRFLRSRSDPLGRPEVIRYALWASAVASAGALAGFAVVDAPWAAWVLLGAVSLAVLLLAPPPVRIGAAVLAAVCARFLVASGLVSNFANFFHYPIALGIALVAAVESAGRVPARRPIELGVVSLLLVSLLSWLLNGGETLRPFLDWLVFAEPFLIIYAIITMPQSARAVRFLWTMALVTAFLQLPIAAFQAASLGLGDRVQGYFIGMGAGAHVAGAVSLASALVCIAKALTAEAVRPRVGWLIGAIGLFLLPILSDAKQVIIAFLPPLVLLILLSLRLRPSRAIIVLPVLAGLVLGAFSYYRPLQMALDWNLIGRGVLGKATAVATVAEKLSSSWAHWLFGLGPGNSISRVAQMGLEAFVKRDSPVFALGLGPAAVTRELYAMTASSRLFAASSVWSGVSSWLGLLGDLGLAGMVCFGLACGGVWAALRRRRGWETGAAKAVLLMFVLLGFMYSWLEEPGFTSMAALVVGLGLVAGTSKDPQEAGGGKA
jgi:hypothetical protein